MTQESVNSLKTKCSELLKLCPMESFRDAGGKVDPAKAKECIQNICRASISDSNECEAFLSWMETHEFFKSPASTRFHGNWEGGLCVHSLIVCLQALTFAPAFAESFLTSAYASSFDFTAEEVVVSALAHDFCKSGSYKVEFHNTKDIFGNWVKKSVYKVKTEIRSLGHGNESVLLLLECMPSYLKKRHVLEAISRHMGFSDVTETEKMNYSNFLQNPLVLLIQTADQTAAGWWDC